MTQPRNSTRTQINIDGRTYTSVEEMPPDVRRRYEQAIRWIDRDGNSVPDVLEGAPPDPNVISQVTTSERIIVNDREYQSWDEVPPEVRGLMRHGLPSEAGGGPNLGFHLNIGALFVLLLIAGLIGAGIMWWSLR